tara:strand:- start:1825 stop:2703 length:879 start_codon:yes stop_codon:yes gene_type:complete
MKNLIEKYINKQDKLLISSITNQDLDELIDEVKDWSIFNNPAKHIVTRFDEKGMHLLRCLLAEKIIDDIRETKFKALELKEYTEFKETGMIIKHGIDLVKDSEWIAKTISICEGFSSNGHIGASPNVVNTSGYDNQHSPHVDTFQSASKLWIYLNNMPLRNGPFTYVKGSNRNTKEKLSFLYKTSTERSRKILSVSEDFEGSEIGNLKETMELTASFRVSVNGSFNCFDPKQINDTLISLGFNEETPVTGESGTFCLADTSGIHRRFKGEDNSVRKSVRWSSLRRNLNPFSL